MKKIALIIVSLSVGVIIGYLYRDFHSEEYKEVRSELTKSREKSQYAYTSRYEYYTGKDDWEDLIFQECEDFGPV